MARRDGWTETTIGEVADVLSGFAFKSDLFSEKDGIPLIRIRDLQKQTWTEVGYVGDFDERYVVNKGDFLIGMDGEFRCYEWRGEKGLLNQRVCRIQDFALTKIAPRFVYFLVNNYLEEIEKSTSYTTVKHISVKQVKGISFPLPPLTEQKRIVDVVSSVDAYIDALQQEADTARTARNAVLHELLSVGGDDWTETTLGEVSNFVSARLSPENVDIDVPYVGLEHIEPRTPAITRWGKVASVTSSVTPFEPGDVLFGRLRPYLHKVSFADFPGVCSPEVLILRASTLCMDRYLHLLCSTDETVKKCVEMSAGTRMPRTSTNDLASIEVLLPPIEEQERIVEIVSSMDDVIQSTEQAVTDAKNLRSGLLSDLLSGEHEIPESYDVFVGAA